MMIDAPDSAAKPAGRNATRHRLLAAAEQVIIAEGLNALTVRRVGDLSGLNPTLITYHFGTVARLLEELCERNLAPMRAAWAGMDGRPADDPRALLGAWLAPLLAPAAFAETGRALVVLDEVASHGDDAMRQRLFAEMAGVARLVRQSLAPHVPHLDDAELQARMRYVAGAALGPPPRIRAAASVDRDAEQAALLRFAAQALELPALEL